MTVSLCLHDDLGPTDVYTNAKTSAVSDYSLYIKGKVHVKLLLKMPKHRDL